MMLRQQKDEIGLSSNSSEEVYVWFMPVDILFLRKVCCHKREQICNILFTVLDCVPFLHALCTCACK